MIHVAAVWPIAWVFAGFVAAQEPNVVVRESTVIATVDAIDRVTRVVTFHGQDSRIQSVFVDPSVAIFRDLKVKDVVVVRYVESVIVQVQAGAKPGPLRDTTKDAVKANEQVVSQVKAVVTFEGVDAQGFVTYLTHDNRRVVRPLSDRRLVEGLSPGDKVEVTMTRERAVSIERR